MESSRPEPGAGRVSVMGWCYKYGGQRVRTGEGLSHWALGAS